MEHSVNSLNSCSSGDEDEDPTTKAQREKERRQANNARERYTVWHEFFKVTISRKHPLIEDSCEFPSNIFEENLAGASIERKSSSSQI